MTDQQPFSNADLEEDPELAAALTAAFGAEGLQSFSEVDQEKQGPHGSLSELVQRLDAAMERLGSTLSPSEESPQKVTQETRCVVVECAGQVAAFKLDSITEIERLPRYTILPRTPEWCLGVANIRGQIVSVTDLAALANATSTTDHNDPKVVIVHSQTAGAHTAIVVDRVIGIRAFDDGVFRRPNDLTAPLAVFADQIANADGQQILILNADRVFEHPDMLPFLKS